MTTAEDERRIELVDTWRRRGTGAGYVLGRTACGDHRVEELDADRFGEFFATNGGDWQNVAELYERFVRESGKDSSSE